MQGFVYRLEPVPYCSAMVARLRQALFALVAFALIGGPSHQFAQAMPGMAPMTADMPCDMGMPHMAATNSDPAPCKAVPHSCCKQLCCTTVAALPARFAVLGPAIRSGAAAYWPAWPSLAGFVHDPEPFPPRSA